MGEDPKKPNQFKCKICQAKLASVEEAGIHAWKKHRKKLVDKRLRKIRERAGRASSERNRERDVRTGRIYSGFPVRGGATGLKR